MPPEMSRTHKHGWSLGDKLTLGTAALAGGIILSPYLLPAIGIGEDWAMQVFSQTCGSGDPTGLAGALNEMLEKIPIVGETLAGGGWGTAAAVGGIGVGGYLLSRAMEKGEDGENRFHLSDIIRKTAMATSMLIALPSILTGISMGVVFLSALLSNDAQFVSETIIPAVKDTLGVTGSAQTLAASGAGLAASASHLLSCGLSLFPATLPWLLGTDSRKEKESPTTTPSELYLDATTAKPLSPGHPNTILIRLADKEGHPVTPEQLAEVHEKKLHVFVTDTGLCEYHHIHPESTQQPGIYAVPFTPQGSGSFQLWAEATPAHTMHEHILRACLPSLAAPSSRFDFRPNRQVTRDGLIMEWNASPPLREGTTSTVTLTVTDAQGRPVTLQPHLGAMAHVAGFSEGDHSLIHTHAEEPPQPQTGPLHIRLTPDKSGKMRFFVEVSHGGKVTATAFDQSVFPGKAQAQDFAAAAPHAGHAGADMAHGRM